MHTSFYYITLVTMQITVYIQNVNIVNNVVDL